MGIFEPQAFFVRCFFKKTKFFSAKKQKNACQYPKINFFEKKFEV